MTLTTLGLFIIIFSTASISPGMCMILSLTMGMTVGHLRTLWMMLGELIGVAIVTIICGLGAGTLMLKFNNLFILLKYGGGAYLFYLAIQLWLSKGSLAISTQTELHHPNSHHKTNWQLASKGFITAIANPKAWTLFIALLPPFLNDQSPLLPQIVLLLMGILLIEFINLNIYCYGGQFIRKIIGTKNNIKILNRTAGTSMVIVALWLVFG